MASRAIWIIVITVLLRDLTIVTRIAVDQDANHTELLSTFNFEPAVDAAIFSNGNLALELNASVDKILVVLVTAVVDEYKRRGDVARGRISVECRDAVLESRGGVIVNNILLEGCLEDDIPVLGLLGFLQQAKTVVERVVDVDIVGDNLRLDTELFPLVPGPLGLQLSALNAFCSHLICLPVTSSFRQDAARRYSNGATPRPSPRMACRAGCSPVPRGLSPSSPYAPLSRRNGCAGHDSTHTAK